MKHAEGRRTHWRAVRSASVAAALALVALLPACSSDSSDSGASTSSPTSSTVPVPGTAKILAFDVPASVACASGATSTKFPVTWETSGAKKIAVNVDAAPISGATDAKGTAQAEVHCDPIPHDVVIIATDRDGHFTTDRKIITTTTPPA